MILTSYLLGSVLITFIITERYHDIDLLFVGLQSTDNFYNNRKNRLRWINCTTYIFI